MEPNNLKKGVGNVKDERKTESTKEGTTNTSTAQTKPRPTTLLGGQRTVPSTSSTSTPPKKLSTKMKASSTRAKVVKMIF